MPDSLAIPAAHPRLRRQLITIRQVYFLAGIGISVWAIIVPFAKLRFHLNDAALGLILMAAGSGGVLAMPFIGPLIGRFGSRAVLICSGSIFCLCLPLLNLAPTVGMLAVLLFIFGAAFAAIDIAMNAQAVVLESRAGRLLMSGFHALYSLGSLATALLTSLLLKTGLSNETCACLFTLLAVFILTQTRHLLPRHEDLPAGPAFALPNRATLLLGVCCFACFLTEGCVTDWSTVFLRFTRDVSISNATLGYAGFSVMMALSRFTGDAVATRFGKATVMRLGALLAAFGLGLAVLAPAPAADILGFSLVGLGAGNMAPLIFGAASRVPGMAASLSVPAVVSLGYVGFLTGPAAIGFIAHHSSLAVSLALDGALMLLLAFVAQAIV